MEGEQEEFQEEGLNRLTGMDGGMQGCMEECEGSNEEMFTNPLVPV